MTLKPVTSILTDDRTGAARGVLLEDGTEIRANVVLSNATPEVTFGRLVAKVNRDKKDRNSAGEGM